jgi:RHS repeat-associated protein
MSSNYLSALRKSYFSKLVFCSLLSNLVVFGEPMQQMMLMYHTPKYMTVPGSGASNIPNKNTQIHNTQTSPHGPKQFPDLSGPPRHFTAHTVFYAPEKEAVVGADPISGIENPYDNFFTVHLPDSLDTEGYEAVMTYELHGVAAAAQTTKRINNQNAYGGQAVTVTNAWQTVSETLPKGYLHGGANEIFFNLREAEPYRYKVKNLRVELLDRTAQDIKINGPLSIDESFNLYFAATLQTDGITEVEALGEAIPVRDGVVEHVFRSIPANLSTLSISYKTAQSLQKMEVPVAHGTVSPQYSFRGLIADTKSFESVGFNEGYIRYDSLLVQIDKEKLDKNSEVVLSGLEFKDLKALNPDIENVTAGNFQGYRVQMLGFQDSVGSVLHMKYDPEKIPDGYTEQDIRVFRYDTSQRSWIAMPIGSLDVKEHEIVVNTYFQDADYINGVIQVPDSPEAGSFVPTAMAEVSYADPSAGVVSIAPPTPNSSGIVSTAFPLKLPQGRHGQQPSLQVTYNSEAGNSWMGIGWNLALPAISLNTKWGAPRFDLGTETEIYSLNGSDLVFRTGSAYTSPHRTAGISRVQNRQFYERREGAYNKIVRMGSNPSNYYWIVTDKKGNKSYYGGVSSVDNDAVMRSSLNAGNIAFWALKRTEDTYGNYVEYFYNKNTANIGSSNVVAQEFYPDKIRYTLANGVSSYYEVSFKRNSYSVSQDGNLEYIERPDALVNARNGYIQLLEDLLTEVHISLVQSGQEPQRIRTYRFDYQDMPFRKRQLKTIAEYDTANNLFYTNTLEYYNDYGTGSVIGSAAPWSNTASADNLISPLVEMAYGVVLPNGSALGTSVSSGESYGLRVGGGIGMNPKSIVNTTGGLYSYSPGRHEGRISFIDINGDGLPDKVFKTGNSVYYRPNIMTQAGQSFGSPIPVGNISAFGNSFLKTNSGGVDSNAFGLIGAGKSWSKTTSTTDNYFTDFNGDGLPDIVSGGRVRFNVTTQGGTSLNRTFADSPENSENNIFSGAVDPALIDFLGLETMDELREQFPQFDHVKVWLAPYNGIVTIDSDAILTAKNNDDDQNPNSFKLTIEKGNFSQSGNFATVLGSNTILSSQGQSVPIDRTGISVVKGDMLFFRIHNMNYGYGGEVEWNPMITYNSMGVMQNTSTGDDTGKQMNKFQAQPDYIMNNDGGIQMKNTDSEITLDFNLEGLLTPYEVSDDVRFKIQKIRTNTNTGEEFLMENWTVTVNHINGVPSDVDIHMDTYGNGTNYVDSYYFEADSDSNIDWGKVNWQPSISGASGTYYPGVNYRTYDDNVNQKKYWLNHSELLMPTILNPQDGETNFMRLSHDFFNPDNSSSLLNNISDSEFPLKINWVVKEQKGNIRKVLHKRTFYIVKNPNNGNYVFSKTTNYFNIVNLSNDTLYYQYNLTKQYVKDLKDDLGRIYAGFYIENKELAAHNATMNGSAITLNLHPSQSGPAFTPVVLQSPFLAITPRFCGYTYRGWGQFLYNGGLKFEHDNQGNITNLNNPYIYGDNPIELSEINFEAQASSAQNIDPNTLPDDLPAADTAIRYTFYNEDNQGEKYKNESIKTAVYGFNTDGKLTATLGRFGEESLFNVYIDPDDIVDDASGVFPGMKQRSESKGTSESGNLGSINGTLSQANSKVLNQYIDLNGDRYPDIVTGGMIQYTGMFGGLAGEPVSNNFITGDSSEDRTSGFTLPLMANSSESANGYATGNKTITNINAGINSSNGESFNARQWVDMNGDGLPDKVEITGSEVKVWLNTGYGFTSEEVIWGSQYSGLLTSRRSNISAGNGFTYTSSFAAGFGAAQSTSHATVLLVDINGDGLPDLVRRTTNSYTYNLNTGKGFLATTGTYYSTNNAEQNYTISGNLFGSFTGGFTFPTPIPGISFKLTFTPTAAANANFSEKRATIQDLNGDGLNDIILKTGTVNNSSINANLNKIGKTHLLKKVNTPLGGSWTVTYDRNRNTYSMPQNKWLLNSIETHDGFEGDSGYGPNTSKIAISYQNPYYDRREREFFGFETVIINELDTNGLTFRTAVNSYHNENYYLSGLQKASTVYNNSSQMLSSGSTLYNLLNPDDPAVNANAAAGGHYLQANLVPNAEMLLDQSRLFVAVARTISTSYEGNLGLTAQKDFLNYNSYGNLTSVRDNGTGPEDACRTEILYYPHDQFMSYGPGFPQKISVYKNDNNLLMRERQAAYNNGTGGLFEVTTKLNETENNKVRLEYDVYGNLTKFHDLENKNEAGTGYYSKTITYDTALKMFPVSIGNSFGETSYLQQYNYLFGMPMVTEDINGQRMRTRIDNRGRIVEVTGPNEMNIGGNAWTIRMEYENESMLGTIPSGTYVVNATGKFEAIPPGTATPTNKKHYALTRHFDPAYATGSGLTSTNQFLTVSLVDGFGAPIQVKRTHQTGSTTKWMVSGFEKKDAFGRVLENYLPIVETGYPADPTAAISPASAIYNYNNGSSGLELPIVMTYDAKNRVATIKQPGESQESHVEYSIEGGLYVQKFTNELGQTVDSYSDIRGRQLKTVENGERTTTSQYNAIDELINTTDHEGFISSYVYDLAGRITEMRHPDSGIITSKYDKASRITEQGTSNLLAAGGLTIKYFYDCGRLKRIEYPQNTQNNVKYTYGAPTDPLAASEKAIGRLLVQEDATGMQLFGYGAMGELTKNLRSVAVADYQSYWFFTEWKYDSWNRVREITYPDQEKVTYAYNKAGALQSMSSQMNGIAGGAPQPVISAIVYNDYGERASITHGSGSTATTTTYNYDVRRRMNSLSHNFTNLNIAKGYTYDALSNITDIVTNSPQGSLPANGNIGGPVAHHYEYDNYNRLAHAEGAYTGPGDLTTPYLRTTYELDMEYNADHTIKKKTQLQQQGYVNAYSDNAIIDVRPVKKTSYVLDYGGYGDAMFVSGSYGYQQPHAPRTITETPSYVANPAPDDPRIKHKKILYDANGNQTEVKEVLGGVETSLRKNLWDEENSLMAVDLKPDDPTAHPIAIYTYDAGGERTVRYNYDRIDVSSNATEVGQARKDNVMLYPSGLIMGKAARLKRNGSVVGNTLVYTKHYYIGSERVSAKTGTLPAFGDYPQTLLSSRIPLLGQQANTLMRTPSNATLQTATQTVVDVHEHFDITPPSLPQPAQEPNIVYDFHDSSLLNTYYFHPDHLGSSSYITNGAGVVCQHMEYLPFGETLIDEHLNSNNSPFKFNGKEYDEETGNYYYSARYYDPKLSIFISVDPLVHSTFDAYGYCYNNPVNFTDPTGMQGESTYKVDKKGYVEKVDDKVYYDENGKEVDLLIYGEPSYDCDGFLTNNSTYVEKGILDKREILEKEADTKELLKRFGHMIRGWKIDFGDNVGEARKIFEFLSNQTEVEYSLITQSNPNVEASTSAELYTSHTKESEYFGVQRTMKFAAAGFLLRHDHNHPYGDEPKPSDTDKNFRGRLDEALRNTINIHKGTKIKSNSFKLYIYHNKRYYEYYPKN